MAQDETTLRAMVELGAWGIALASVAILVLALGAELTRRRHGNSSAVVLADRLLPTAGHRAAVAVLAIISSVVGICGSRTASADDSIRDWLGAPEAHGAVSTAKPKPPQPAGRERSASTTTLPAPTTSTIGRPAPVPLTERQIAAVPAPRPAPVVRPRGPAANPETQGPRSMPSTPTATASPLPPPMPVVTGTPLPSPGPAGTSTVQPGDCLWTIARRALAPTATNTEIDRAWRAIYDANREAIGNDPNLIHPGLVLLVPFPTINR